MYGTRNALKLHNFFFTCKIIMKKMIIAREKAGVRSIISDKYMGQKRPEFVYFLPSSLSVSKLELCHVLSIEGE